VSPPAILHRAGRATTTPDVVEVPARSAVAIDGAGPPEDPGFQRAVGALYGVAYGLKFARKPGGRDFKIGLHRGALVGARGPGARPAGAAPHVHPRPHVEVYLSDPRRSKPERLKSTAVSGAPARRPRSCTPGSAGRRGRAR